MLSVFGSVARGDARPDSDVDLLYVRVPGNDLGMSYFALQEDLGVGQQYRTLANEPRWTMR
jgi:predicted nucleotidyltransferase